MNRYVKISAALAAFALLLVVMGLSTQGTVNAVSDGPLSVVVMSDFETAEGAEAGGIVRSTYICSKNCEAEDTVFMITVNGDDGSPLSNAVVTIHNLDLSSVEDEVEGYDHDSSDTTPGIDLGRPDANPKTIVLPAGVATVTAVHQSSGLRDNRFCETTPADDLPDCVTEPRTEGNQYQIKAFNGNRIQISHTPNQQLGRRVQVVVDNVDPTIVVQSPATDLVTKGGVNVTFSADVTDTGAGFKSDAADVLLSNNAEDTDDDAVDVKGRIQLYVGINQVALKSGDFEEIDGGWRVSKAVNSSDIMGLSSKVPWYFSVEDLAGNTKVSAGNLSGKTSAAGAVEGTTLVAISYGRTTYPVNAFEGRKIKYTTPKEWALTDPERIPSGTVYDGLETDETFTVDAETPEGATEAVLVSAKVASVTDTVNVAVENGDAFNRVDGTFTIDDAHMAKVTVRGTVSGRTDADDGTLDDLEEVYRTTTEALALPIPAGTTFQILNTQRVTVDNAAPRDPSAITGHRWSNDANQTGIKGSAKSIKVSFDDANGSGLNAATVTASAFTVAGNVVNSVLVRGNNIYLTLAEAVGSTEKPSVSIGSGQIADKAGNAYAGGRITATDGIGPNLSLSKDVSLSNDEVVVTVTTDEQLDGNPAVTVKRVKDGTGNLATSTADGSLSQSTALTYRYVVGTGVLADDEAGGEFNVYAIGNDTQFAVNEGDIGNSKSAASASAFTFELDRELNDGINPDVQVSEKFAVQTGAPPKVEAVDPMIVTVKFDDESGEYPRDSYSTVELLSASMKITFKDGSSETKDFNLTTEISSPDNKRFTIPLLNPRVGTYTLTVTAQDSAGNNTLSEQTSSDAQKLAASWEVIPAKPVGIALKPGWNLVSLPFQPGNPAINSVINASHPADIVMTYDNATRVWLVSRRDAETGLFVGDIAVMTASTAYFIRTDNFQELSILRPPVATAAAAPPPPPAITVVEGWNLVPIVTNDIPVPPAIGADDYFGTLNAGTSSGWLKALTFDTLTRTWTSVTPGDSTRLGIDDTNPCTGKAPVAEEVEASSEACQIGEFVDRDEDKAFNKEDSVTVKGTVVVGKGYWLYSTVNGVIIP